MNCRNYKNITLSGAGLRRMLTLAAAALSLGTLMPAAQSQSPMPQSPGVPTPYSWPTFHAGGASETPVPTATYLPPNPLSFQLQGTPTGLIGQYATEIPSFLLGNYNPALTLGIDANGAANFPNHFRDDTIAGANLIQKWSAPYDFVTPAASATGQVQTQSIVADDQDTGQTYPANSGIATGWRVSASFTGGWGTAASPTATPDPLAATTPAPPYSYRRAFAVNVNTPNVNTNPTLDTATYRFVVPAGAGGSYSALFQLPEVLNGENRISDAHYVITRTSSGGTVTTLYDGRVTQADANSPQFIAGPFAVAVADTITVSLDNSTDFNTQAAPVPNSNVYVLADSVSLVPGVASGAGNAFEGSPTAIDFNTFPEIQDAFYYGFAVTRTTDPVTGQTTVTQSSDFNQPFGNPTIGTPDTSPAGLQHRIRQLVYFGRSENIVLTDTGGNPVDAVGNPTTIPVNQTVGAIYCVDGLTGQTVWRFQTPNASAAPLTGYIATGLAGVVHSATGAGPQAFQIGPTAYTTKGGTIPVQDEGNPALDGPPGTFGTYTAYSSNAPQISGNDLSRYGYSLYAQTPTRNADGTYTYTGKFRIYAPGYGYTADGPTTQSPGLQILEHGSFTLTATFAANGYDASLAGTFTADPGTLQPAGWPQPVDFAPPGMARFTGQFHSDANGNQSISNGVLRAPIPSNNITTSNSAGVFTTPAIARMNVLTSAPGVTPQTFATKLCVVVADDNGLVYCLDAIGNRNGTSNQGANNDGTGNDSPYNPTYGQPIYNPFATLGQAITKDGVHAHVGNTNAYWIYRPGKTKQTVVAGVNPATQLLPTPQAFGQASPTIVIDPTVATDPNPLPPGQFSGTGTATNSTVYIGNSNGTLYKLNGQGIAPNSETYNASQNIAINSEGYSLDAVNTCQPLWWFPINGISTNQPGIFSPFKITSAPSVSQATTAGATTTTVYVAASNDINMGHVFAVNSTGPAGPAPGAAQYNTTVKPRWQFPAASTAGNPIPAFGSITGSPVVFTNPDDGTTRVYFGANVNKERNADVLQNVATAGRIWAVDAGSGAAQWAYPNTYNPNTGDLLGTAYADPIGTFQYSTPAIGIVQYPASIVYGSNVAYAHADSKHNDIKGQQVPMLYLGAATEAATGDVQGSNFFALDLDGTDDNSRNTFYFAGGPAGRTGETITGAGFQTSPLLIVNSTTTSGDGHGGAVFLAGTDYILREVGATYTSDSGTGSDRPQLQNTQVLSTLGGLSSPAAAAYSSADLQLSTATGSFATDWVYCGDSFSGFCRGITPANRSDTGGTIDYGTGGTGIDYGGGSIVVNNAPLHAYIFDGTTSHPGTSTNMNDANAIGSTLPLFEWGGNVYIRISNVVPPNPNNDPNLWLSDGTSNLSSLKVGDIVFSNGGGFTVQLSDIGPDGKPRTSSTVDFAKVPATVLANLNATGSPGVIPSGFVRSTGKGQEDGIGQSLVDATGSVWIGAATHTIGDGSSGPNTPGSRRRILSASQNVSAYRVVSLAPTVVKFAQSVTLNIDTSSAPTTVATKTGNQRLQHVDQPTFGILNPIAVRGGGPPIPLGSNANANAKAVTIGGLNDGVLGPFSAVNATPTQDDLPALSNGNMIYTSTNDVPMNGVLTGDRGKKQYVSVITSTNDIAHGTSGDNGDPTATTANPPTSSLITPLPNRGKVDSNGNNESFGAYALNVADRSLLGFNPQYGTLKNLTMEDAPALWNDNTTNGIGPGAVVNPLPWDDTASISKYGTGSNNLSLDYPDVPGRAIHQTLITRSGAARSLTANGGVSPDAASGDPAAPANRTIQTDTVQVKVTVPKYQPANLQIFSNSMGTTTPDKLASNQTDDFPMGYVAEKKIFVKSNRQSHWVPGEAYRIVKIFTGVPVDMTTQIVNQTTDLGKLPQSFGVQTDSYNRLSAFVPYNSNYQSYFKPVTVLNQGNVNLLNVQFDQRYITPNGSGALSLRSDALDPLAAIQGFDLNGVTGPRTVPLPGGYSALPFLIRSSLDTDLVQTSNYGRNPGIVGNATLNMAYPGATFHKPRVSDAAPTLLTVPDLPHDNIRPDPAFPRSTDTFYLPIASNGAPPTLGANNLPAQATLPYAGLAVPLGTPVGSYSAKLQLFEGIDPTSASYINLYNAPPGQGNYYKPLLPPVYGGIVPDGTNPPIQNVATGTAIDANGQFANPVSTPTVLKGVVTETRVTDGVTYGNLPQYDAGLSAANGTADFLPAAFRNTFWNNGTVATGDNGLSLYWTSARGATATTPYRLIGGHVPFNIATNANAKQGYFAAANNQWFTPLAFTPIAGSVNTAISIAPDQHLFNGTSFSSDGTAYAFVQNVAAVGTAYQNNLYCYQVNTATGSITGIPVPVSTDTRQPKFGARGLKYAAAVGFHDALAPNALISDNLWAFWNGGTRGRSSLFYSSALSANVDAYMSGGATPFTAFSQALPTPAGLSGVADPTAVLTQTTLANGNTVPALDVTYSGVNADGNTDVYVSRYLPYFVRKADGTTIVTDVNGKQAVALALTPSPAITEQLLPDTARQFYQARDVAWARADTLDVQVNNVSILRDTSKVAANGISPLYPGIKTSFDRATGSVVYTGIPFDKPSGRNMLTATGGTISVTTIYADLVRGRVRFRTGYTTTNGSNASRFDVSLPDSSSVTATFQSQARRITTDRRADTEPVSFLDEAFKNNEANFYDVALRAQGGTPTNDVARVSTARYWFIWRKSAAPGTTTTPTLYTKSQRLTVYLHGPAPANSPVSIQLDATTHQPIVKVTDTTTGTILYNSGAPGSAQVDVDWSRGRLYFPLRDSNGHALEGDKISVDFTYNDGTANGQPVTRLADNIHWLDELRYNDTTNQPIAALTPGVAAAAQPTSTTASGVDTTEHAVPIDVATNEGSPSAFLDPLAYADVARGAYDPYGNNTTATNPDQPHKVWLFWNSTRNGTADVYYETIDPRFSATP